MKWVVDEEKGLVVAVDDAGAPIGYALSDVATADILEPTSDAEALLIHLRHVCEAAYLEDWTEIPYEL